MRPSFHPRLINDPFSDPGLFIPFLFEKRALMFDLGDLQALSSKELLKVTHVFVTHSHMDHFIGFDTLIRLLLGRDKEIHLFGPIDFFSRVEGKLAGYTWNLVDEYPNSFTIKVTEVHPDKILTRVYKCKERFRPAESVEKGSFAGILHRESAFYVEAAILDHRIPCLGLSLIENFYVNIIKEGLRKLGLTVGPWINRFKKALYENEPLDSTFRVTWEEKGPVVREKRFILGDLVKEIAMISPGQKITYITDVIGSPENTQRIIDLAKEADHLFIEAAFMDCDREVARKKYHLTAREAGELARKAKVKKFTLFHFSPRYRHMVDHLKKEALESFTVG